MTCTVTHRLPESFQIMSIRCVFAPLESCLFREAYGLSMEDSREIPVAGIGQLCRNDD